MDCVAAGLALGLAAAHRGLGGGHGLAACRWLLYGGGDGPSARVSLDVYLASSVIFNSQEIRRRYTRLSTVPLKGESPCEAQPKADETRETQREGEGAHATRVPAQGT